MIALGFAVARRHPALVLALLVASLGPALLGVLPLDLSLAPHLDLQPAARALVDTPADDGLLRELLAAAPALTGVAAAAVAIALVLGIPSAWLAASFLAARAVASPLDARGIAARGLGATLTTLPLRALPIIAGVVIGLPAADDLTLSRALPRVLAAGLVYALGASTISVLTDFTRGIALVGPERSLFGAVRLAARAMARSLPLVAALVLGDVVLGLCALALVGASRPLGVLGGALFAVALAFVVLRAFLAATFVAAAAARGAALRSA